MKRLAYYAVRDIPSAGVQLNDVITLREDGIWIVREVAGEVRAWQVPVTLAFAFWQEPYALRVLHEHEPNWVDADKRYRPCQRRMSMSHSYRLKCLTLGELFRG